MIWLSMRLASTGMKGGGGGNGGGGSFGFVLFRVGFSGCYQFQKRGRTVGRSGAGSPVLPSSVSWVPRDWINLVLRRCPILVGQGNRHQMHRSSHPCENRSAGKTRLVCGLHDECAILIIIISEQRFIVDNFVVCLSNCVSLRRFRKRG